MKFFEILIVKKFKLKLYKTCTPKKSMNMSNHSSLRNTSNSVSFYFLYLFLGKNFYFLIVTIFKKEKISKIDEEASKEFKGMHNILDILNDLDTIFNYQLLFHLSV